VEDQQKCTPDPNHPPFDTPLTPAGWEESAGFRETFLYYFYEPADVGALRHLTRMLHESSLEMARYGPVTPGPGTREELAAAAADLRHTQGFLAAVARTREESVLPPADAALAELAARMARAVAGIAAVLEQAVG
jgi:hypothetical protein